MIVTMRSTSAGVSDSIPSTGMPSAIFSSMPRRAGNSSFSWRARPRTWSVSSSSRLGTSATSLISPGSER